MQADLTWTPPPPPAQVHYTTLPLPKTCFPLFTSFLFPYFPPSIFDLFWLVFFLLLSSQLLVSSERQGDAQLEERMRLPYHLSLPLLSSCRTAGWLPLETCRPSAIGELERDQQKRRVQCIARPGETILSPVRTVYSRRALI